MVFSIIIAQVYVGSYVDYWVETTQYDFPVYRQGDSVPAGLQCQAIAKGGGFCYPSFASSHSRASRFPERFANGIRCPWRRWGRRRRRRLLLNRGGSGFSLQTPSQERRTGRSWRMLLLKQPQAIHVQPAPHLLCICPHLKGAKHHQPDAGRLVTFLDAAIPRCLRTGPAVVLVIQRLPPPSERFVSKNIRLVLFLQELEGQFCQ